MKKTRINKNFGMIFILGIILSIGSISSLFHSDNTYSPYENRSLETSPTFSLSSWNDKSFQTNYSNYTNDQFPGRNRWMSTKTRLELAEGVKKFQDVYIGSDNYLIQTDQNTSTDKGQSRINAINSFKSKYSSMNFTTVLVPNKISIYEDKLPSNATKSNQNELYDYFNNNIDGSIKKIDTRSILKSHANEEIFYHTDHHWTTKGAKYVADNVVGTKQKYDIKLSNDDFSGTLANKIGYRPTKDTINIYLNKSKSFKYVVNYLDTNTKTTSFYDSSKQQSTDAYDVFLGGNHPCIKIKTTNSNNKKLLIFKDSYANCFIPFIAPYYSEITIVDPRYYYDDINTLIEDNQINEVMFVYNMNTFYSDTSLEDLIK
ncbi:MAG: DHHW family protein [Thomasclavelia sp.]|nr:DHHW family protein [Thomasclavelia sp.]